MDYRSPSLILFVLALILGSFVAVGASNLPQSQDISLSNSNTIDPEIISCGSSQDYNARATESGYYIRFSCDSYNTYLECFNECHAGDPATDTEKNLAEADAEKNAEAECNTDLTIEGYKYKCEDSCESERERNDCETTSTTIDPEPIVVEIDGTDYCAIHAVATARGDGTLICGEQDDDEKCKLIEGQDIHHCIIPDFIK